jgi:hypothetical protein
MAGTAMPGAARPAMGWPSTVSPDILVARNVAAHPANRAPTTSGVSLPASETTSS